MTFGPPPDFLEGSSKTVKIVPPLWRLKKKKSNAQKVRSGRPGLLRLMLNKWQPFVVVSNGLRPGPLGEHTVRCRV